MSTHGRVQAAATSALFSAALLPLPAISPPPSPAGGGFVERALEVGLEHEHLSGLDRVGVGTVMLDWAQSGIALGDVDGEGGVDVVACGGLLPTHVFTRRDGAWADVTAGSGIESTEFFRTPALGDYDADGDLDLFLGALDGGDGPSVGRSRLYRNEGEGRFEDVTALAGTFGNGHTIHAKWADVDLDGRLDLSTAEFHGSPNQLYLGNGDGSFRLAGESFGMGNSGSTHVLSVFDSDTNGYADVLVGNDYNVSLSQDLTNNSANVHLSAGADGKLTDVSRGSGFANKLTTMGLALGDVNYDGRLDVYQTEFEENYLLLNGGWPAGGGAWEDAAPEYGVVSDLVPDPSAPGLFGIAVGWGTTFAHLDLDRWVDLVVVNGHVSGDDPRGQQNYLYMGQGPGLPFLELTEDLGFFDTYDDRALAAGDADGDGDVDLFVGAVAGRLRYYENQLDRAGRGWLRIEAVTRTSAPGGQGTYVSWTDASGLPHVRVMGGEAPAASQHETAAFFGLGPETEVDVRVDFPSGLTREYEDVPANSVLVAEEPELVRLPLRTISSGLAGSPLTIRAFAHDAAGTPLGGGADVSIEMEGLVATGSVEHVAGNEFQRTFLSPSEPGLHRVEVRFDDFEVLVRPRLVVQGRVDRAATEVRFQPQCVRAGGGETASVTAVPKTRSGAALGPGASVRLVLEPEGQEVLLEDRGDGRYTGEVAAPATQALHRATLWIAGPGGDAGAPKPLAGVGELEASGPVSPSQTELYTEPPHEGIAAVPHQMKIRVTPRDVLGLRLSPATPVAAAFEVEPGSQPVSVRDGELQGAQNDGEFWFILERPEGTPEGSAEGTLTIEVDGDVAVQQALAF